MGDATASVAYRLFCVRSYLKMPSGKPHSAEVKAAVMSALLTGQSVAEVAAAYEIPAATIKTWRRKLRSENILDEPQKKDELGGLLIDYLRENLTTLAAQSRHARDADWLKKQSASELAVLHGVIADKTVRLLAALEPVDGSNS